MLTIDEFEEGWQILLDKYRLHTHPYMTQLFKLRHKWILLDKYKAKD